MRKTPKQKYKANPDQVSAGPHRRVLPGLEARQNSKLMGRLLFSSLFCFLQYK